MKKYFPLILLIFFINLNGQDIISGGSNKWQFHTPDDGRQDMYVAPDVNGEWLWANQTKFKENGDILISGNVGIGTIAIDAKLRIEGSKSLARFMTEEDGMFKIYATRSGTNKLTTSLVLGAQNHIILDPNMYGSSGNVGIGTMAPVAKLDVYGTIHILKNTEEQLAFASVHRNGTDNRSLIAPRTEDNSLWDYNNEFGFHNYNRNWYFDSNVSIGTTDAKGWKLAVNGNVKAKEIKVETSSWSDFVFNDDHNLPTLEEVEKHIHEKGHLKDIPSAKEVKENGFYLGEMDSKLLQKIEELTLYIIEQNKRILVLEHKLNSLDHDEK